MPRQNAIERLQWELDLHDIWRIKNPRERSFTLSQSEPLVLSRLDYWLISNSVSDNVCDVDDSAIYQNRSLADQNRI